MRIVVFVVVICLVLTAAGGCAREAPEQALAAYIELWWAGDYAGMYNLLSVQAQAACEEEVFVSRHRNISEGVGLTKLTLALNNCTEGKLKYQLEFDTSTVGKFCQDYTLEMVEEEGGWRLNWDHCHIFPGLTSQRVVRVKREMPERGDILDRNLTPLASTGTVYEVGLVPGSLSPNTINSLALLLDREAAEIESLLGQGWVREDSFVPVATVDSVTWAQVRQPATALPGVLARARTGRVYNIPLSLSQTIGYIGRGEAEQLGELAELGFEPGDLVGLCGLEQACDRTLAGRPGQVIDIRDENNNTLSVVAQRPVIHGEDVVTTLDLRKIRVMDAALGDWPGSVLLLDFAQGDIVGVVSKPGFDCNLFVQGISSAQYEELLALDSAFLNRAFNGLYPPGSVFKPFTALMALEEDVFEPAFSWDTPRQWQGGSDWGAYQVTRVIRPPGPVDLWAAMRWSDNVYFADLGLKVGWPAFAAYVRQLGFEEPMPFALSYEKSQLGGEEGSVLLADSSYGQGKMLTTPLHLALMYAALARGDGILPRPRLLADEAPGQWLKTDFDQDNLELLDGVLAYAASDSTALAWVDSSTVRGKTGTSEISRTRQIAWYICYFDDYLLVVTLEGDFSLSSTHAVQVARECLNSGIREKHLGY